MALKDVCVVFREKSPHSSVKIIKNQSKITYSGSQSELTRRSPVTASYSSLTHCLLEEIYWWNYNTASYTHALFQGCSQRLHYDCAEIYTDLKAG